MDEDYGESFERFDPVSGLPLPEPEDDADAELAGFAAALAGFAAARDELRELQRGDPDPWTELLGEA